MKLLPITQCRDCKHCLTGWKFRCLLSDKPLNLIDRIPEWCTLESKIEKNDNLLEKLMKCCDNCNSINTNCPEIQPTSWDTSKDFCSKWKKWEEKEKSISSEIWRKFNLTPELAIDINKYYSKRIKESLDKAQKRIKDGKYLTEKHQDFRDVLNEEFDWIKLLYIPHIEQKEARNEKEGI